MTTSPVTTGSRFLWVFAALLGLAGAALVVVALLGGAGRDGGDMVGVRPGDEISIGEDGMSVWARDPGTREATVCTLGDVALLRPVQEHATTVAGATFYEVARTPDGMPGGAHPISCDTQDAVYAGPYGPGVSTPGLAGGTGLLLGIILLALALLCLVLAWLAGLRQPTEVPEQGPDPGDYTLRPGMPVAPGPPPGRAAAPPPPGTGHTGPGSGPRPAPEAPPDGPRYDLPPPS